VRFARHAACDQRLWPNRVRRHAAVHAYCGREHSRLAAHLHRRSRLAGQFLPGLLGYSIGHWIDTDGAGKYDVLEVETRGFTGPRAYDSSGIPLHDDNQTIVKERIYLDKKHPNTLRDEVTVIDHALTRPWTVVKSFRRDSGRRPEWVEYVCGDNNGHVQIGSEGYMISADGCLMPTKKGQQPPDMKYFKQSGGK
jgi:hypothetical protein